MSACFGDCEQRELKNRILNLEAENKRLKDGWERLLRLLDTKETDSNGKEFRPTYISSCRLSHTEQLRDVIASVRKLLEENNDGR